MFRGPAADDASRGRTPDRACLRASHWNGRAVSLWQADRELSGTSTVRGLQWGSAPSGAYLETRELSAAFPVGGSIAIHGVQPTEQAQQDFPLGYAP